MKSLPLLALASLCVLASCTSTPLLSQSSDERGSRAPVEQHSLAVKRVECTMITQGYAEPNKPEGIASMVAYGTSAPGMATSFEFHFYPPKDTRLQPARYDSRTARVHVFVDTGTLPGWVRCLDSIAVNQGVTLYYHRWADGYFDVSVQRQITNK